MALIKEHNGSWKWLLWVVAIFFILALIAAGSAWGWQKYQGDKIYPGVKTGKINLGNKTTEEAQDTLDKRVSSIDQDGIPFKFNDKTTNITPIVSSFSGGVAYSIMDFDTEETAKEAFSFGREGNFFTNTGKRVKALWDPVNIDMKTELKEEEIRKILKKSFGEDHVPARDAALEPIETQGEIKFTIEKEEYGETLDYEQAITTLKKNLRDLDTSPIILHTQKQNPEIYKKESQGMEKEAEKIIQKAPLELLVPIEDRDNASLEWTVDDSQLASWLQLKKTDGKVTIGLDRKKIEDFLEEAISPQVDQEPEEARFEIEDGKVSKFRESKDGIRLAVATSSEKMEQKVIHGTSTTSTRIDLVIETVESKIKAKNINDMGIEEKIGVGSSDFSGSPANRVHNIEVGAKTLEGQLIKPGEEFSLAKTLGDIDKEAGYKPELVIKGNETVPEYGGGLCQIATTMFRAALQSGLEITERRNHSYRVSYYEPAGTDATIYPPHPDLRFINNTDNHILIQYRIEGSELYFEFWGTDDGREVEITDPTIYNLVRPGPTKIIESTELEPGKRRCTERAHTGADAYFDYKVNYSEEDKETKERRFHSHYVPWREICLVGVEKSNENPDKNKKEGATSTPSSTAAFFE